jgi:hypothetical protein
MDKKGWYNNGWDIADLIQQWSILI